jgi:predicted permease
MRRFLARLALRFHSLVAGRAADAALRREMHDHLDELIAEHRARGMNATEARRAALREFGPVAQLEEQCRDTRRVWWLSHIGRDLRYGLRSLTRQPLLFAAAALSIGVATAANTAVFTLVDELLLAPPSAYRPDRLVYIQSGQGSHVSYPQWRDLEQSGTLAGLAGYQIEIEVNWAGPERSMSLMPLAVTANFFDVVGVPVAIGRAFTADEAPAEKQPDVAVISHAFWRNRMGGLPDAVGQVLTFNGRPFTVIGILAQGIRAVPGFGIAPEVYLPLSRDLIPDLAQRRGSAVQLIGRLHDGQTLEQGRAALQAAMNRLDAGLPRKEFGQISRFASADGLAFDFKEVGAFFAVVVALVGLVLAVACANIAGLLISRGVVRRREVAVRAALGASRLRLIQQFLLEAFWIALSGTMMGVLLSNMAIRAAARIPLPVPVPIEIRAGFNIRLFVLSIGLLVISTVLCGLLPALQTTRPALVSALKQDEPRYFHRRFTLRGALVVGQVAVAVVLLLTAFIFVRNLARARDLDPGFDTAHTLVAQISFAEGRHTPATRAAFLNEAVERLRALPGISLASYSHGIPLAMRSGMMTGAELRRGDRREPFHAMYHANFVGPAFFSTMGIDVRQGREFLPTDTATAPRVAIVNAAFVERYFGGDDPIGRQLFLPGAETSYPVEIVGIVQNSKYRTLGEDQQPAIFEPFVQRGNRNRFVHVVVRADAAPEAVAKPIEQMLLAMDSSAAVDVSSMRSSLAFAFLPSRFGAVLLGVLGVLGLGLAMVGLYAAIAYSVARRTAEIGIRIALGAPRAAVLRLILLEAAALAGLGIALGLTIAVFVTQPLGMFLVAGLRADDPMNFVATGSLLLLVSLAAAAHPARRAMTIDPVLALRAE